MEEKKETKDIKKEETKKENKTTNKKEVKNTEKKKAPKEVAKKTTESEAKQKETEIKKETPKKKHLILKTILMLIVILIIVFLIHLARNQVIMNQIAEKQESLNKITNYSYTTEHYSKENTDEKTRVEHYYKDGRSMLVFDRSEGDKIIFWHDEATKETIIINPRELTAKIQQNAEPLLGTNLPVAAPFTKEEVKVSYMFLITSEKIDGIECYKVNYAGTIIWINKEDGTIVKNTINSDNLTDYYDWKLNQLTDEDLTRPNLIGYTITSE